MLSVCQELQSMRRIPWASQRMVQGEATTLCQAARPRGKQFPMGWVSAPVSSAKHKSQDHKRECRPACFSPRLPHNVPRLSSLLQCFETLIRRHPWLPQGPSRRRLSPSFWGCRPPRDCRGTMTGPQTLFLRGRAGVTLYSLTGQHLSMSCWLCLAGLDRRGGKGGVSHKSQVRRPFL